MVGTLGVYLTGQVLNMAHQYWSYNFDLHAFVYVLGAAAFLTR
jgi:hypothetical protein